MVESSPIEPSPLEPSLEANAGTTRRSSTSEATAEDPSDGFEAALERYQQGVPAAELINDFVVITAQNPRQSAGWTCLAWLQLLEGQHEAALRSARTAVRLSPQDPQARINLTLAMLETGAKGVREHIDVVQRVLLMAPEMGDDIQASIADGLARKPGWPAMQKIKAWLAG
jgi:predicted Zn-dependent protease